MSDKRRSSERPPSPENNPVSAAQEFLRLSPQFRLGELPTEKPHPETGSLSQLSQTNLPGALRILKRIDVQALQLLLPLQTPLLSMRKDIEKTLRKGGKIYLCGCGATGRMALTLEFLWRGLHRNSNYQDRVVGFLAGGDTALVNSVEKFEDHEEYGSRQLVELGFTSRDLLIASTEGGETPFVIGATELAARGTGPAPYFLFSNPTALLTNRLERSRRVLQSGRVRPLEILVGPMSLTGSTRLQATTAHMALLGLALLSPGENKPGMDPARLVDWVSQLDYDPLEAFIEREAEALGNSELVIYQTRDFAITILTDTTERSPTFSLPPFDNLYDPTSPMSPFFLLLEDAADSPSAWTELLRRPPRTLEWEALQSITGLQHLYGFDFSSGGLAKRHRKHSPVQQQFFEINRSPGPQGGIGFRFGDLHHLFALPAPTSEFLEHLALKLLLNAHSTLVMGRLGRYQSNLMTWVRPSNNKLIDRAARYVLLLLEQAGFSNFDYGQVIDELFEQMDGSAADESVVEKTVEALLRQSPPESAEPS